MGQIGYTFVHMRNNYIYHIAEIYDWEIQKYSGAYYHSSLDTEGFIHASTKDQVEKVLDRYYKGVCGLILLTIDVGQIQDMVKYESAPSDGDSYPHIYGPLQVKAVVETTLLDFENC